MAERHNLFKASMNKYYIFIAFFFITTAYAQQKPTVFVSILPQKNYVESIAGDFVNIQVMVLPGDSPATYEPTPEQMVKLSKSHLYFSIDVPFEQKWLPKILQLYPDLTIVQTHRGIQKRAMHSHRQNNDAKHHLLDPHIWLSPPLVMLQARHIYSALVEHFPKNKPVFHRNYRQFIDRIVVVDIELCKILSHVRQTSFMVFHPSWGYFADAYGLHQIPIETEGKDVKPSQLMHLIGMARKNDIKVIFAQPQFSKKSANLISKSIDGKVMMIDPLSENWADNLKSVARKIVNQ